MGWKLLSSVPLPHPQPTNLWARCARNICPKKLNASFLASFVKIFSHIVNDSLISPSRVFNCVVSTHRDFLCSILPVHLWIQFCHVLNKVENCFFSNLTKKTLGNFGEQPSYSFIARTAILPSFLCEISRPMHQNRNSNEKAISSDKFFFSQVMSWKIFEKTDEEKLIRFRWS